MKTRNAFQRALCCALALLLTLGMFVARGNAATELDLTFGGQEVDNTGKYLYLSDYLANNTVTITKSTAWGNILADTTPESKKLAMRIEGQALEFQKGIWAHADSTIVFDLSKIDGWEEYPTFSAFVGLNTTAVSASSVHFTISTSQDNRQWTEKYDKSVIGTGDGALVTFNLDGARYLRLVADDMGGNGSDHSIYGEAMLCKKEYESPMKGPQLAQIDYAIRELVAQGNDPQTSSALQLAILQRDFIANFGEYTLAKYVYEHPKNRQFIENLLQNDHGLLELYVFGDPPNGTYSASMDVFAELYDTYKNDLEDKTNGELYARMMVALSKTHSVPIRFLTGDVGYDESGGQIQLDQYDPKSPNVSNPVKRYAAFKELHSAGRLHEMFDYLPVPLLRLSMQSKLGDDEYDWLNQYFKSRGSWFYESWIRYSFDHSFTKDQYHDPDKAKAYQATYNLPDSYFSRTNLKTRYPAQWMVFADAGTCGIISPSGVNCWNSIGVPAFQIHQPAHTAICTGPNWNSANKQITSWIRQNSFAPFIDSAFQVYPPLGWGRGTYAYGRNLSYIWLSQHAINDWENYKAAEYYIKLANSYGGDDQRQTRIELYKKALEKQDFNLDAFLKLIEEYKASEDLDNLLKLGEQIIIRYGWDGESKKDTQEIFALPMYDLIRLILPSLKGDIEKYVSLSEKRVAAFNVIYNHDSDNLQIVKALRGDGTTTDGAASFSFDGPNKKKIILGNMFDANDPPRWGYHFSDYTGKECKGQAEEGELSVTLSEEDFYALYKAATRSDYDTGFNLYVDFMDENGNIKFSSPINIINSPAIPALVTANDYEDTINGYTDETRWYWRDEVNHPWKNCYDYLDEYMALRDQVEAENRKGDLGLRYIDPNKGPENGKNMEFRDQCDDKWKTFGEEEPNLKGKQTYSVRQAATGCIVYSGSRTLEFTTDTSSNSDRYYSLDGITIVDYSSDTAQNLVINAFDGNLSCWKPNPARNGYTDTRWMTAENDTDRYVTVKFDSPIQLSHIEYTASVQDYGHGNGLANGTLKDGIIYGSMDGTHWEQLCACHFELNEYGSPEHIQTKNIPIPKDNQKLVQYVKIQATHTYKIIQHNKTPLVKDDEEGTFSARGFNFFHDAESNKNLTGVISYSTEELTNQDVTARLANLSTQNAVIDDGEDTVVFTQNGTHIFTFTDPTTGKTGTAVAKVDWIDKEAPKAHIEYSTKEPTTDSVVATLKIDEKNSEKSSLEMKVNGDWVPVTDIDADLKLDPTDKKRKYAVSPYDATLDENGIIEFELRDLAGNYATYQADVDWIFNGAPEVEVVYSTKNPTAGNVTATIRGVSVEIFPLENESLTHEFTDNDEYIFHYRDAAGNEGSTLAKVDWIDRALPEAHVVYDVTVLTKGPVTATLVVDSAEQVTILGDGETHLFRQNGTYVFKFRDRAGNIATVEARVTWIAPVEDSSGGKPSKPPKPGKP